jgi:branched-chain amino acid transport system ATP-binding protein
MLELRDLHSYYGPSHVLNGISLEVNKGEVVCLLGRNGAGKSTTLKSIIGIVRPKQGEVIFNGQRLNGKRPFKIARLGIGYVPEDRRIFPNLSVRDNLELRKRGSATWSVERIFEIFPKLKDLQKNRGMQLSGGEQQMLTIARALMTDPQMLLLDEPSEGLAPVIVQSLGQFIRQLSGQVAILLAEQNARFAINLSQRAYIIEKGLILHHATAEEIKNDEGLQTKYLAL